MRLMESDSTNVHLGAVSAELKDSQQHGSMVLGQTFSSAYGLEFSSTLISYSPICAIYAVMSCSVLSWMGRPKASSTLCMMRSHGILGTSMSNVSLCKAFSATNFLYWSLSINLRVKLEAKSSTF